MGQPSKCTHGIDLDQDCRDCEMENMERQAKRENHPTQPYERDEDEVEQDLHWEDEDEDDEYDPGEEDELEDEDFEHPDTEEQKG